MLRARSHNRPLARRLKRTCRRWSPIATAPRIRANLERCAPARRWRRRGACRSSSRLRSRRISDISKSVWQHVSAARLRRVGSRAGRRAVDLKALGRIATQQGSGTISIRRIDQRRTRTPKMRRAETRAATTITTLLLAAFAPSISAQEAADPIQEVDALAQQWTSLEHQKDELRAEWRTQ